MREARCRSHGPESRPDSHVAVEDFHPPRPPDLEGDVLQRVRGLIAATLVAVPLAFFLWFSLHATLWFVGIIAGGVGAAIFATVATRSDANDEAADAAWREAAPDLPPVSDRAALERDQASMPGPEKQGKRGVRP
jgi:hypothetical protein